MTEHEKIEIIRVRLNKPFSDFFVQIEPTKQNWNGKPYYDLILRADQADFAVWCGSIPTNDISEVIEKAVQLGPKFVKLWIEERNAIDDYYNNLDCEE